jgi:hypothetical protein
MFSYKHDKKTASRLRDIARRVHIYYTIYNNIYIPYTYVYYILIRMYGWYIHRMSFQSIIVWCNRIVALKRHTHTHTHTFTIYLSPAALLNSI